MAQIFRPEDDVILRYVALALVGLVLAGALTAFLVVRSDTFWGVDSARPQPIPFRHDLHVGGLGLDCRQCHTQVEREASAGMPSAETCMTCHSQVWAGASVLEPLRASIRNQTPIVWASVSRLPDHVRFHHGIHVANGVACQTCHGRVDEMTETVKAETLSMAFCLDCHREPEAQLRPPHAVYEMGWHAPDNEAHALVRYHDEVTGRLTDCSTCHR